MRRGAPNLYEILKGSDGQASGGSGTAETSGAETAKPAAAVTLAEEKAQSPRPEPARVEVSAPVPEPVVSAPVEVEPPHLRVRPVEATRPAPTASLDQGEKTFQITYNTAVFLVLVVLGLLFVAYSLGGRRGSGAAAEGIQLPQSAMTEQRSNEVPAPPAAVPAPRPTTWSIQLIAWKANRPSELTWAKATADDYVSKLSAKGLTEGWHRLVKRGSDTLLVLYYGRYPRRGDPAERDALEKLKKLTLVEAGKKVTRFAKAGEVELSD